MELVVGRSFKAVEWLPGSAKEYKVRELVTQPLFVSIDLGEAELKPVEGLKALGACAQVFLHGVPLGAAVYTGLLRLAPPKQEELEELWRPKLRLLAETNDAFRVSSAQVVAVVFGGTVITHKQRGSFSPVALVEPGRWRWGMHWRAWYPVPGMAVEERVAQLR